MTGEDQMKGIAISGTEEIIKQAFKEKAPVTSWFLEHGPKIELDGLEKSHLLTEKEILGMCPTRVDRLPLPITHMDFQTLNQCKGCAELVAEKVEETILQSLRNPFPHVKPFQLGAHNVKSAIGELAFRKFYGPFLLIIGHDKHELREKSFRIRRDSYMKQEGIGDVIASDLLKFEQIVLVQTTPDVFRIVVGLNPKVVEWEIQPGVKGYKCLCIIVPQPGTDFYNNLGIAVR